MRRAIAATLTVSAALLLAACSAGDSTTTPSAISGSGAAASSAPARDAAAQMTASSAFAAIGKSVPTARLTETYTAANDPNSLLGRPGEYTSKISFSDSRVPSRDTSGLQAGDVQYGGIIEVFASTSDAQTRFKYVESITKAMAAFAEYDYLHGTALIRVSHYLTPDQAKAYDTAAANLG
jgi:hypothetical protein